MDTQPTSKITLIKTIYFYLVSFVALMMVTFATANLINVLLKTYVFTLADQDYYAMPASICAPEKADASSTAECVKNEKINQEQSEKNRKAQKQRDLVNDISMIVVGIPLFAFHWNYARKKENF